MGSLMQGFAWWAFFRKNISLTSQACQSGTCRMIADRHSCNANELLDAITRRGSNVNLISCDKYWTCSVCRSMLNDWSVKCVNPAIFNIFRKKNWEKQLSAHVVHIQITHPILLAHLWLQETALSGSPNCFNPIPNPRKNFITHTFSKSSEIGGTPSLSQTNSWNSDFKVSATDPFSWQVIRVSKM